MKLKTKELKLIQGGASVSASFINAIVGGFEFIYELGKSLGTAIARAFQKTYC